MKLKENLFSRCTLIFGLILFAILSQSTQAEITIAVVGKTKNDTFYEQSYKGCVDFAKQHPNVECIYDGADDYQDFRTQSLIINELLNKKVDGLLISTTDSNYLVSRSLKKAKQLKIPVITFDSDLLTEHKDYRLAYVGTDNFAFGVALGEAAKPYKKAALQSFCIQTGHHSTPNLDKRIKGVRYALSTHTIDNLTKTENDLKQGWREYERCPLYTMGKREDAISQLLTLLSYENPPIFIAVAGFAQFHSNYIERVLPYKEKITNYNAVIISADTEEMQLKALGKGLSTINIGQNPYEMGRKGAELLYNTIALGQAPSEDNYYLDFHYCNQTNILRCTVNH